MRIKKLLIIFTLLLSLFQPCVAQQYTQKLEIRLQVAFDDYIGVGKPCPRMPTKGMTVTFYGTRLVLDERLAPCLLIVTDNTNGSILYSQYIVEGDITVDLPQLPSGSFTITFKKQDCSYWGCLNL